MSLLEPYAINKDKNDKCNTEIINPYKIPKYYESLFKKPAPKLMQLSSSF